MKLYSTQPLSHKRLSDIDFRFDTDTDFLVVTDMDFLVAQPKQLPCGGKFGEAAKYLDFS